MNLTACLVLSFFIILTEELVLKKYGKDDPFSFSIYSDGSYIFVVNNTVWLESAPTFFRSDGQEFSLADNSLKMLNYTQGTGDDILGPYISFTFKYQAGSAVILAIVRYYPNDDPSLPTFNNQSLPFVMFQQAYPNGVQKSQAGSHDNVISGFPGFMVKQISTPLGYLSYGGIMTGDHTKKIGTWATSSTNINSGLESGPLAIFDQSESPNVLILSSASSFMSASMRWRQTGNNGTVYWGTMGGVTSLPANFETSTIVVCSNRGINKAFESWGNVLRSKYKRQDSFVKSDLTIDYLGYWTDNGAYYYYHTESGKNYEQTMVDLVANSGLNGIPIRYLQLDSWWYIKGKDDGVKTWKPMSSVFPKGLQWLFNKTGLPVCAHNKYWASDTTYAHQNGGDYKFDIYESKSLPLEERFWNDLFEEARTWGLITYEQDWLNVEFEGVESLLTDAELGEQWLRQMGQASESHSVTIQYCMALPRHILQSLTIPTVTQARASEDYQPGSHQWKIGISSIFAWAIGIVPFKDTFWTSPVQPGNKYNGSEPYTELNAVVATLSTGPVGPSDMVGALNKTLIMRSIRADGMILKPSRPATAIDNMIRKLAWTSFDGPEGELWSTYSDFGGQFKYGIILAANLTGSYALTPFQAGFQKFPKSVVYKSTEPGTLQAWDETHPLTISGCTLTDFCLYHVSPAITFQGQQIIIQGELDKWVPMSPQRIAEIRIDDDIQLRLLGAPMEKVKMSFNVNNKVQVFSCIITDSGSATFSFVNQKCYT